MITLDDHHGCEPAPRLGSVIRREMFTCAELRAMGYGSPDAAKQRQQAERIALWAAQKPRPGLADCTILHDVDDDGA